MKIKELKTQIIKCLDRFPETRNSDVELTIRVWKEYYPKKLVIRKDDNEYYVALKNLFELPREDNIKRIRAKLQNEENRFLPTVEEVAKQRKINMDLWHKAMAFNKI